MYTRFYGFSEKPFNVTPDPKFLYLTPSHREVLASMIYGIKEKKGFISITGEVGTGKTTLIYTLLNNLNEKIKTVLIFHTTTTFEQLLKNILLELELPIVDESKTGLLHQLNEYLIQLLSREETLAIIIDEAQNLPKEVMEELRMLSNLETSKSKLLQIVLVGQPELGTKLDSDDLRQLKQRVAIRRQIKPLSQEDCKKYIEHRLNLVGSNSSEVFTSDAISLICKYSQGIPRTINIICDNAFLIGYGLSQKKVGVPIINEVIGDLDSSLLLEKPIHPRVADTLVSFPSPLKTAPLYNRVASTIFSGPILLLICLGLLTLLGMLFLQNSFTKTPDIPYPTAIRKAKKLPVETPKPSVNSELSSNVSPALIKAESNVHSSSTKPEPVTKESSKLISAPSATSTTSKAEDKIKETVSVKKDDCIFYLAQRYYHMNNETLADLILEVNPEITNANLIRVNEQIKIPEITEESLIITSPDNTYKIYLGTFQTPDAAKPYSREATVMKKEIEIIPRKVSPTDTWYRVVLGKFNNRDESLKAVSILKQKGLLPSFGNYQRPNLNQGYRRENNG